MDNGEATECLGSMLDRQLRIYTTDTRMFVGEFKCTDNVFLLLWTRQPAENWYGDKECNIILAQSHEYRFPTSKALETASESIPTSSLKLDMNSRYLGLIVVPGQHIVKIEIEDPLRMRTAWSKLRYYSPRKCAGLGLVMDKHETWIRNHRLLLGYAHGRGRQWDGQVQLRCFLIWGYEDYADPIEGFSFEVGDPVEKGIIGSLCSLCSPLFVLRRPETIYQKMIVCTHFSYASGWFLIDWFIPAWLQSPTTLSIIPVAAWYCLILYMFVCMHNDEYKHVTVTA